MNRRRFIGSTTATLVSLPFPTAQAVETTDEGNREDLVDIHQHLHYLDRANDVLVSHQRALGVSKTVLLPAGSPMERASTHGGKSNGLAARVSGTEAAEKMAARFPKEFAWFANEVPDAKDATARLEKWLARGACGIGELKFALECDGPAMRRIYDLARAHEVPVLLHFEQGRYNHGFERFHKILEAYPTVNFFGHAQTWWGNIDANHKQEVLYPRGPVEPGGLTDRYLSDYPNMFGDLSAGSGLNALTRDLDHAAAFVDRHQDKLCYATDCPDHHGKGNKCSGAKMRDLIRRLAPDPNARTKIFSGNARRVINRLADS